MDVNHTVVSFTIRFTTSDVARSLLADSETITFSATHESVTSISVDYTPSITFRHLNCFMYQYAEYLTPCSTPEYMFFYDVCFTAVFVYFPLHTLRKWLLLQQS